MRDDDLLRPILSVQHLGVRVAEGGRWLLRDVSIDVPRRMLTAIIGPSGAGKSTFLKCLNRLIDLTPSLEVSGRVLFEGRDTRAPEVDADDLRRRVGIVFQQPVVFPGSIEKNVLFAAERLGLTGNGERDVRLHSTLSQAGLWDEVKDRLHEPAARLSVGQQQRLAVARTLAGDPDVILMDEPTSALDPRATAVLEETIFTLKKSKTIVLVTHHLQQARRLADFVACICLKEGAGELVEADRCERIFTAPSREETIAFLA